MSFQQPRNQTEQTIRMREQRLYDVGKQQSFSMQFWTNKEVQAEHQAICALIFDYRMKNLTLKPHYRGLFDDQVDPSNKKCGCSSCP